MRRSRPLRSFSLALHARPFLNFFLSVSSARPLSRCLRIAHNFAVLTPSLLLPSLVPIQPVVPPLDSLSLCPSLFLPLLVLIPGILIPGTPLYRNYHFYPSSYLSPFSQLPLSAHHRRLVLPSEFIKVSGVFSRN